MTADIVRPMIVVGILLAAAGYAATKELQWEAELPLRPAAPVERIERVATPLAPSTTWQADAVTVQPEQIFQD